MRTPLEVMNSKIRGALRQFFGAPQYALLFEVSDATGAQHRRFADAVAMGLWPSQGLNLNGIEIKVTKYDWRRERQQPEKAETIAAYCDFWWLVTGPNVVEDVSEIPDAWGWMEYQEATKDSAGKIVPPGLVTRKRANQTEVRDIDRRFLAALLRRASNMDEGLVLAEIEKRDARLRENYEAELELRVERRVVENRNLRKDADAFTAATGLTLAHSYGERGHKVGRAVKAVLASGVDADWQGMWTQADSLRAMADRIEDGMAEAGFEREKKRPKRKPRRKAKP